MRKGESGSDVPSDREGRGGEASNREDQKGILTQQSPPPSLPLQLGEIAGEGAAPLPTRPCKRRGGRGGEGTERFVKTLVWGSGEEERLKNGVALQHLRQKKTSFPLCLNSEAKRERSGRGRRKKPYKGGRSIFPRTFRGFFALRHSRRPPCHPCSADLQMEWMGEKEFALSNGRQIFFQIAMYPLLNMLYMTCLLDNVLAPSLPTPIFVGQSRLPPPPLLHFQFEADSKSRVRPSFRPCSLSESGGAWSDRGGLGTDRM